MDDLDLIEGHAELLGNELSEGGFMPLAVAVRAGEDTDRAGRIDPHRGRFVEPGTRADGADDRAGRDTAGLDIGRDADAPQLSLVGRGFAPCFEAVVIGFLQRDLQGRLIVAAVVLHDHRRLIGEGVARDEVPPPDLRPVYPGDARRLIDDALDKISRFRPPGAAIGVDRYGMGEDGLDLAIDHRRRVDPRQEQGVEVGRNAGREGR